MTIVVYFDDPQVMGYPFDERNYYLSYQGFSELCARHGVQFFVTRGPQSYAGNMVFQSGWKFAGNELVEIPSSIHADIIYDKGTTLDTGPHDIVVNHPELSTICRDKLKTYALFEKYMPKTVALSRTNWQEEIQDLPGNIIVVKPVTGLEGKGIIVTGRPSFRYDQLDPSYAPYCAQEFIDCSEGIEGLVTGRHDLRLYVFNGKAKLAEYRQPKPGGYLANIAQGGSLMILQMHQVPQWALDFVPHVDYHFQKYFPRIYTIDLMYANDRPYLVELNSRPGLPFPDWSYYDELHRTIFETLMSAFEPDAGRVF